MNRCASKRITIAEDLSPQTILPAVRASRALRCCALAGALLILMVPAGWSEEGNALVTSIDTNQHGEWILLRHGEPWFRAGYFMPPNYTAEQLEQMVTKLADAGFNHMHVRRMGVTEADFAQWLSLAETLEIGLFYSLGTTAPERVRDIVAAYQHLDVVCGWYLDDVQDFTHEQLENLYGLLRDLDPDRTTDWSGGWRTDFAQVMPTTDVFHRQFYPISDSNGGRNHARMYDTYDEAKIIVRLANETGTVPGMDLQGAYSSSGRDFWPNARETDLMFYLSAIAGIKSVRWYPYGEIAGTEVWEQTQVIVSELNAGLAEVFLLGRRTDGAISPHAYQGTWEHDGSIYVIVCNAHSEPSGDLTIPLPAGVTDLVGLFDYRSTSLTAAEGSLTGTLPPLSVEIYHGKSASAQR